MIIRAAVIGGGLALLTAIAVIAAAPGTFDGSPPTPLSYQVGTFLDGWDVQVHSNQLGHGDAMIPMTAQHGMDCAGPPATHPIGTFRGDAVFQCRDHVMTSINADAAYMVVALTMPQMVDFTSGQGQVKFAISTEDVSGRDWWDLTISPFIDAQAVPLLSDLSQAVDLQGPNRNSIVITTDENNLALKGVPNLKVVTDGVVARYGGSGASPGDGVAAGTNEAAVRQQFLLTINPTHIKFERLASSTAPVLTFINQDIPALTWRTGTVQFGHHSYNPAKDGSGVPQTWHWDDMSASPSVPLGIQPVSPRYANTATTLTTAPAPAGSFLRFSGLCKPVVDGAPLSKVVDSGHPEHTGSYLIPVMAGSTSHTLEFAADDWYTPGFGCFVADASIMTPGVAVTSTPIPTATPTSAPTPTATPTATPTVAPTPTPTATPSPCFMAYWRDGVVQVGPTIVCP
jgi:cell division septation protein DedD